MKISKFALAALFAAGFLTASATAGFAEDKPEIVVDCVEGYYAVYSEDGSSASCEAEVSATDTDPRPTDCWVTPEGGNVCARGVVVPPPVVAEEEVPVEVSAYCMPEEGEDVCNDVLPIPKEATLEDGSVTRDGEQVDAPVDETLMYQSGVAMPASGSEPRSSNMLAAVGVLVGALGALAIGISRKREAK
jgi:hypothetical protein